MTPSPLWLVIAAIALLAGLRRQWRWRRLPAARRPGAMHVLAWWTLHLLAAVGLALALQPPALPAPPLALRVLTAGHEHAAAPDAAGTHVDVVALPGAADAPGAARVPDLATALRRHPAATRVDIVGDGLGPRDLDAGPARPGSLSAPPPAPGVVALATPAEVVAGRRFAVHGRVEGVDGARLQLLDPAGQRQDEAAADADGAFALQGRAGPPGPAGFRLRLLDAAGRELEAGPLPVDVQPAAPRSLLLLAGGPSPELKYLRRWALDAGLSLHTRIATGGGVWVGDAPVPITADALARFDLLLLDERAWRALRADDREAVQAAVRAGLGLLLRVTGPLAAGDREALAGWGFRVEEDTRARSLTLAGTALADEAIAVAPGDDAALAAARAEDPAPVLSRRPLQVAPEGSAVLLGDARGQALARWRAHGRGRVGLWWLSDSFRLVLAGRAAAHGSAWGEAVQTLARARPRPPLPTVEGLARAGERVVVCGVGEGAEWIAPDGQRTPLLPDPASGPAACAAAWPTDAGWHRLRQGGAERGVEVWPAERWPALVAASRQAATRDWLGRATAVATPTPRPGPRWPGWLAWLLASAGAWALERRRAVAA